MFLSIPRAAARRESQGTRDTTPVCANCFTARWRCTRYWRRAPCLWAQHARGPFTQGPRGVHRTRLVDPMTGIGRRCNGRAVAALCRCGLEPHLHSAATARPLQRRPIPVIGSHGRVRSTPLGPWANGPRVCCAHRHGTRRQQRVQRRRAVKQLAQTGVVSRVLCDSRRAAARGIDRNTYPSSHTAQYRRPSQLDERNG